MPSNSPEKRSRSGPIAALVVGVLLVAYPLSEGPVARAARLGWLPRQVMVIYAPLEQLERVSDTFTRLIHTLLERGVDWCAALRR